MGLLLPPRVEAEIQKEKWVRQRAEHRALAERLLDFDDAVCREWQPVLRELDSRSTMGRAKPQAYAPGMNIRPGFYHRVRYNETAPITIEPITGPDGGFVEPDSSMLDALRSADLQNPSVRAAVVAHRAGLERQREAEKELERERRVTETLERFKALGEGSVSMAPGWSQNVAGKKGRKK